MANRTVLTEDAIAEGLASLSHWTLSENSKAVEASFKFKTFSEAFAFMTRVAHLSEVLDHHPDWSNSYNRVNISLTTHSSNGITSLDMEMAQRIESLR